MLFKIFKFISSSHRFTFLSSFVLRPSFLSTLRCVVRAVSHSLSPTTLTMGNIAGAFGGISGKSSKIEVWSSL